MIEKLIMHVYRGHGYNIPYTGDWAMTMNFIPKCETFVPFLVSNAFKYTKLR